MLLRSALVTILALPVLISGYQVPTVDGVIGGIPSGDTSKPKTLKEAASIDAATTPTPGKLRVVENSGVCGGYSLFVVIDCHIDRSGRNHAGRLSGIRIW
jgi:hypothetical protein